MKQQKETIQKLRFFGLPRLWRFLRPYRLSLAMLLGLGMLGGVVDAILPLFQRYAIDHYVAEGRTDTIGIFMAAYIGIMLFGIVANTMSAYASCQMELYTSRDMRRDCFNHLQTLSASYYNTHAVGYVHARLISDIGRISVTVSWVVLDILYCGVYIVGAVVSMFMLRPSLAAWVALLLPIAVLISALFKRKLTDAHHRVREANSVVTGKLNEGITGATTVKSLVLEEKMKQRFGRATGHLMGESMRMSRFRALFASVFSMTASVALALILWRGGIIAKEDVLFIGTLSVFLSYAQEMVDRLNGLVNSVSSLISAQVNIERFVTLMDTHTEVVDTPEVEEKYGDVYHPKKENWEEMVGDIEFRDVTFRYPDGDENVLEHFHLHIPAGTNCAIVGETGAGKSTLVNLVCRFFEPTEGTLLLDGRDIKDRSLGWLHAGIGYVLQTPHLFSGSVRENLLFGNPDATEEDMRHAVEEVSAQGVVERLGGYDADVGEGGDRLSTGEKQLLSFARALIAKPRLFILDEATSSIDTVTEQKIQAATEKAMEGRTSLVIAHRLSTIRRADMILVVRDGKIVERGTHDSLMEMGGYYHDLYRRQYINEAEQRSMAQA